MKILSSMDVSGDIVRMRTVHAGHLNPAGTTAVEKDAPENFAAAFKLALGKVSDQQLAADNLVQRFVRGDTDLEAHDVVIGVRKAEQSLAFAKAIQDRLLRAFSELQTLR